MFDFIKKHRTWTLLWILAVTNITWLGYTNLWEPYAIVEGVKEQAGETVDFTKDLIDFVASKDVIDLIKTLTPILLPIVTWKIKHRMDKDIRYASNIVMRDTLGIADRRKNETTAQKERRKHYKEKQKQTQKNKKQIKK